MDVAEVARQEIGRHDHHAVGAIRLNRDWSDRPAMRAAVMIRHARFNGRQPRRAVRRERDTGRTDGLIGGNERLELVDVPEHWLLRRLPLPFRGVLHASQELSVLVSS
jgi:hypothetical protein